MLVLVISTSIQIEIIGSTLGTTVIDANALNDRVFHVTSLKIYVSKLDDSGWRDK